MNFDLRLLDEDSLEVLVLSMAEPTLENMKDLAQINDELNRRLNRKSSVVEMATAAAMKTVTRYRQMLKSEQDRYQSARGESAIRIEWR